MSLRDRCRVGSPVRDWVGNVGKTLRGAALTYRAVNTGSAGQTGSASTLTYAISLYTGSAVGDIAILTQAMKRYDCSNNVDSAKGMALLAEVASGTTPPTDTGGSIRAQVWCRTLLGSDPTGNPTLSAANNGYLSHVSHFLGFSKASGPAQYLLQATTGSAEVAADVDVTGAQTLGLIPGDVLVVSVACSTSAVAYTDVTITVPGCTLTTTQRANTGYATNADAHLTTWTCTIDSGIASGPPRIRATAAAGGISAVVFLQVRGAAV